MYEVKWKVVKKSQEPNKKSYPTPQAAVIAITKKVSENKEVVVLIDENKDGYREKNIKNKISELYSQMLKTQTEIKKKEYEKLKSLSFKKCPHCDSKINTKYLKNIDCLVCGKPILSIPSKRKMLEIQNKLKVEKNKLETVKKTSKKYHIKVSVQIKED